MKKASTTQQEASSRSQRHKLKMARYRGFIERFLSHSKGGRDIFYYGKTLLLNKLAGLVENKFCFQPEPCFDKPLPLE